MTLPATWFTKALPNPGVKTDSNRFRWFLLLLLFNPEAQAQTAEIQKLKIDTQHRIDAYLDKEKKLGAFYSITDQGFELFSSPEKKLKKEHECIVYWNELSCFELNVIPSKSPFSELKRLADSHRTTSSTGCLPVCGGSFVRSPGTPLAGYRIALDPGHTAGTLESGRVEQKFLDIPADSIHHRYPAVQLVEGHLTLGTALTLKKKLEAAGATVLMTHSKPDETAFGMTFEEWMKTKLDHALDSLVACKTITNEQRIFYKTRADKRKLFRDIFRDLELQKRADLINAFKPDITVIIHYNVDEKNTDWKKVTDKDFVMTFIGGSMLPADLNKPEKRFEFLRLALTNDLDLSEELSSNVAKSFTDTLHIPIAGKKDADYLDKNCLATKSKGVYCRNLILTRIIHSPLVYGETIYQDNKTESLKLMQEDAQIEGVKTSARVRQVADAYYSGILVYFHN